jgi:hypothetical protein
MRNGFREQKGTTEWRAAGKLRSGDQHHAAALEVATQLLGRRAQLAGVDHVHDAIGRNRRYLHGGVAGDTGKAAFGTIEDM